MASHPDVSQFFAECPHVPRLAEFEAQASTWVAAISHSPRLTHVDGHPMFHHGSSPLWLATTPAAGRARRRVPRAPPACACQAGADSEPRCQEAGRRAPVACVTSGCVSRADCVFWSARTQTRLLTPCVLPQWHLSAAGAPLRPLRGQLQRWEPWSCVHGVRRRSPLAQQAVSPALSDKACRLAYVSGTCCSTGTRSSSCTGRSRRSPGRFVRRCQVWRERTP